MDAIHLGVPNVLVNNQLAPVTLRNRGRSICRPLALGGWVSQVVSRLLGALAENARHLL